jgi:hypothetical protein
MSVDMSKDDVQSSPKCRGDVHQRSPSTLHIPEFVPGPGNVLHANAFEVSNFPSRKLRLQICGDLRLGSSTSAPTRVEDALEDIRFRVTSTRAKIVIELRSRHPIPKMAHHHSKG